jgi:DNA-binding MarR family transcriptional regulator
VKKHHKTDALLVSMRKIMRSVDLHSKKLVARYGLTGPQMLLLKHIYEAGDTGIINSILAKQVSLSMATITSIMDRLISKNYVQKIRSDIDKRKVYIIATDKCKEVMNQKPNLLQENFTKQFELLQDWEQTLLLSSFERVASMMGGDALDASPILFNNEIEKKS